MALRAPLADFWLRIGCGSCLDLPRSAEYRCRSIEHLQFLGARVAALLPRPPSFGELLGTGVTIVVSAWALGYAWAWLYNRFAR